MDLSKLLGKEGSFQNELNQEMLTSVAETLMPKLKPFITPMLDKLKEYMGNNSKMVMIRQNSEGELFIVIVETEGIEEMKITEGKFQIIPIDKYLDEFLKSDILFKK